ncbi:MAG: hypothetical protein RBT02_11775 [Bacteroidales bacterium]|nr:hypothetical protein [Bacteroidales bacterium]
MSKAETATEKGTYGYDVSFFAERGIKTIELKDEDSQSGVLIIPAYQGRVMTSTSSGNGGISYGWINYDLISSGKVDRQFNPVGGEERFWLGPEGGPFSIYFSPGVEQVYENWLVPPVIDTESFEIFSIDKKSVKFSKNALVKNAYGTEFKLGIQRTITLLSRAEVSALLNVDIPDEVRLVGYQSENIITNLGEAAWTKEGGLLSIWMLGMFNPSPETTVFIPFKPQGEGQIVNDEYFGKVPSDRLIVDNNTVFFKIDGKLRSKIGIPPERATELCGSYDSGQKILTLLWCTVPAEPEVYVNSQWGQQDDPYKGDVINSYNDGPVEDGSIMGPFYEIETSSPAAALPPSGALKHVQRVMHIEGDEASLAGLVNSLFGLDLKEIACKFQD